MIGMSITCKAYTVHVKSNQQLDIFSIIHFSIYFSFFKGFHLIRCFLYAEGIGLGPTPPARMLVEIEKAFDRVC